MRCRYCQATLAPEARSCEVCSAPLSEEALSGHIFSGRWELLRRHTKGGNGAIYEARKLPTQEKVAVKVLQPHGRSQGEAIERFRREAIAAGRLSHPSALRVYEQGQEGELFWLAMEWIEGETLQERLNKGPLSLRELWEIFSPLCEVLEEAHQKGITHRDLKPDNVMLGNGEWGMENGESKISSPIPQVKLLDFGLAGLLDAKTLTNPTQVSGTPKYMAPEQWEALSNADPRSDIYSLGVMLYQSLSGRFPLEASSPLAWFKKHRSEAPLDLKEAMSGREIPEGLYQLVMKSLSKNPKDRQQSVTALKEALYQALFAKSFPEDATAQETKLSLAMAKTLPLPSPTHEKGPLPAPEAPAQSRATRETSPKKTFQWLGLSLVVVVSLVFFLWWVWQPRQAASPRSVEAASLEDKEHKAPLVAAPASSPKTNTPQSQPAPASTKPTTPEKPAPKTKATTQPLKTSPPQPTSQPQVDTSQEQPQTKPSLQDGALLVPSLKK